ncbi:putative protein N(5)-glutamine methyltransferase [Actinocorallia populi]|uniref:putative protein N(5)-glutamine methyltransferase n=1 Tax=Actinocorallia populi TaxID=2079200 RepID=UPI000D08672F|nr:putative protein N(5)-glutamine methyltransferase [Actinocorallia populi]
MAVLLSSTALSAVVARLRAAGCVFAEDEAALLVSAAADGPGLDLLVGRRAGGLPLEQVVGWAEFRGSRVEVDPGVFVPRRRSEFLVAEAVALARPGDVVVDLCCGSGALGVALAEAVAGLELHAADVEPAAVRCARRNVARAGGRVYEGDLFGALPGPLRGRVGVLLANVPYVPSGEVRSLPAEARLYEPKVALDGGADGLEVLRRVSREAPEWLAPGGHLLVEVSGRQCGRAVEVLAAGGLVARAVRSKEWGSCVVVGSRPRVHG